MGPQHISAGPVLGSNASLYPYVHRFYPCLSSQQAVNYNVFEL
jgi:hypothetical protein